MKPKIVIYLYRALFAIIISSALLSCKKFLDIDPPVTKLESGNVFLNDNTANAVVAGIYSRLNGDGIFSGRTSLSTIMGLSADEFRLITGSENELFDQSYANALNVRSNIFWSRFYQVIVPCNTTLKGLQASTGLTPAVRNQLMGEMYFLRSFLYFYLTEIHGGVPLVLGDDYNENSSIARSTKDQVYTQILSDLSQAEQLLSNNYLNASLTGPGSERIRPIKPAALALQARVYLYQQKWKEAEEKASAVIGNKALFDTVSVGSVFLKNSKETIWQLYRGNSDNTEDANFFIIRDQPSPFNPVFIDPGLVSLFDKSKDHRFERWIGSVTDPVSGDPYYFPYKYHALPNETPETEEYLMVLRLSELYLIRAEARARQGLTGTSAEDLNLIRKRAGLDPITSSNPASLLNAIEIERQMELVSEWGHRWLDLKRTGRIDAVMGSATPIKGGTWSNFKQYFNIPLSEIEANGKLIQNQGY
jgi:hypothetical protein